MPQASVRLRPGVNTDATPALNEAGISASNMIRFRDGLVEKRGGWTSYQAGATSGVPRNMAAFIAPDYSTYVAVGATNQLVTISGGAVADITPRIFSSTPAVSLSTTSGSPTVTITDPNFNPTTYDYITFNTAHSVGGLVLETTYKVASVVNGTQFTITVGANATSTVTNGGTVPTFSTTAGSTSVTVTINYIGAVVGQSFPVGNAVTVGGLTLYGSYTVTTVISANQFTITASAVATSTQTVSPTGGLASYTYTLYTLKGNAVRGNAVSAQDWSIAPYGDILLANNGGLTYSWSTADPYTTAVQVTTAPQATGIIVADSQQMVIAYGTGTQSGNLGVSWSDAGSYTTWTASGTNQDGSFTIPTGSKVVGAIVASQQNLVWTDIDVWSMTYIGYPFVWSFNKLATGCGLIAQYAMVRLGSAVLWMSQNQFWIYDGNAPRPLSCPVWDQIFPVLRAGAVWKIRAAANSAFNEAVWYFPSTGGSGENDSYICYNIAENAWDYGSLARSAWMDQSLIGLPLGADPSGNIYQHETSTDAAGSALTASFTTGYALLDEGETFAAIKRIIPDFKFRNGIGTVQVTVLVANYPGDTPTSYGPYSFTAATEYIVTRCRGRYVALQFTSSDTRSFWRIGRTAFKFQPDGRR